MCRFALLALIAAVVACGPAAVSPAVSTAVDCDSFAAEPSGARTLTLPAAGPFSVTLCSNASTGFAWEEPTWDGDLVLEYAGRTQDGPVGAVGAAGTETFAFRATGSGSATIHFTYSQPWAGGTKGAWRLDLSVASTD